MKRAANSKLTSDIISYNDGTKFRHVMKCKLTELIDIELYSRLWERYTGEKYGNRSIYIDRQTEKETH